MNISHFDRCALGFCVGFVMLAGCGSQGQIGAPDVMSRGGVVINRDDYGRSPMGQDPGHNSVHQQSSTSGDLYVTTANGDECCKIVGQIYKPGATEPSKLIKSATYGHGSKGHVLSPVNMGFDHSGNLYIANSIGYYISSVWVFAPGQTKRKRVITDGITEPFCFAFDKQDNVYVANGAGGPSSIAVYTPGGTKLKYTITEGVADPYAMAFDAAGNLYVVNAELHDVAVYAPGKTKPLRTISKGLNQPQSLAFDASGNLYVASYLNNKAQVYAPGKTEPSYTISRGINGPVSLVFDHSGNLFVANQDSAHERGDITVYAPGKTTPSYSIPTPGRSSECGFQGGPETQLAFDISGNLYVGYFCSGPIGQGGYGAVAVFPPGTKKPTYLVTWPRADRGGFVAISISP